MICIWHPDVYVGGAWTHVLYDKMSCKDIEDLPYSIEKPNPPDTSLSGARVRISTLITLNMFALCRQTSGMSSLFAYDPHSAELSSEFSKCIAVVTVLKVTCTSSVADTVTLSTPDVRGTTHVVRGVPTLVKLM